MESKELASFGIFCLIVFIGTIVLIIFTLKTLSDRDTKIKEAMENERFKRYEDKK